MAGMTSLETSEMSGAMRADSEVRDGQQAGAAAIQPCAVCEQVTEGVFRYLAQAQYDLSYDPGAQQEHARRGGFCALHTWQYERLASPQGICTAYPVLLRRLAAQLLAAGEPHHLAAEWFPDGERCTACGVAACKEEGMLAQIRSSVAQWNTEEAAQAPALCLAHLLRLAECVPEQWRVRALFRSAARALERVACSMDQYTGKRKTPLTAQFTPEELAAPRLAVNLLAGHKKVLPRVTRSATAKTEPTAPPQHPCGKLQG
jgi:hypothetical protein